ncbi:MAG: hypothetical protein PHD02_03460 [Bacilli bacterium]|nr:hypothetical protein [Bacilli bacterium]
MKKLLIFFLILIIPMTVHASPYCDYNEYNEILKKAGNVNIMVDYKELEDSAVFTITLYNIQADEYIVNNETGNKYYYADTNNGIISFNNITEPKIYKFTIYSTLNQCDDSALATLYATVPTYNKYYKNKLCEGIEDYKLCQRWSTIDLTYEEFKSQIDSYKASKIEEADKDDTYKSIFDYMLDFYLKYYYYLLPSIIVISIISIFIIKKRENKFKL